MFIKVVLTKESHQEDIDPVDRIEQTRGDQSWTKHAGKLPPESFYDFEKVTTKYNYY